MSYKTYYTRLRFGTCAMDKYVQGVIMGMMLAICKTGEAECERINWKGSNIIGKDKNTGDYIYSTVTTRERYYDFMEAVEKMYPGTCEFDIIDISD